MARLAIKGDYYRPSKVLNILTMLGGDTTQIKGSNDGSCYYIGDNNICFVTRINDTNQDKYIVLTTDEFDSRYPYSIGDNIQFIPYFNNGNKQIIVEEPIVDKIVKMRWNEVDNTIIYFTERDYILTAEMALKQNNNIAGQMSVSNTEKVKTIEVIGDNFADNVELVIDENKELITIDGKYYIKNKRPQYPKTFAECAELTGSMVHVASTYKSTIIHALNTLYVCRDAYWKLDDWKADFGDSTQIKYSIIDTIIYDKTVNYFDLHNPLLKLFVFKTPETRNEFYKNFKDYILKLQDD